MISPELLTPNVISDPSLRDECRQRSIALLRRNLTSAGLLAATPSPAAEARRYTRVFARDAAISALGMEVSGDVALREGACRSLESLAAAQSESGQIPNFVDASGSDIDFWYLGCIDATLWWLIAVALLRQRGVPLSSRLVEGAVDRAIYWARCQEHPAFALVQQNEASDWADIMPRSGYVLYTNALWYYVKRLYGLPGIEKSRANFNLLFDPASEEESDLCRLNLLAQQVRSSAPRDGLYVSFVNFAACGTEGDLLGNLLALLFGLAEPVVGEGILRVLREARVESPYPVRALLRPVERSDPLWRPYMDRHQQNRPHCYHNGGAWPFIGGFWTSALARRGEREEAERALEQLADANRVGDWRFSEWFDARNGEPSGMAGQSWNAAMFLLADHLLAKPDLFDLPPP